MEREQERRRISTSALTAHGRDAQVPAVETTALRGVRASSPAAIEASRLGGRIGRSARDWDGVRASNHSLSSTVMDGAEDLFAFQAEVDSFDVEGGEHGLLGWSEKHSRAAKSFPRPALTRESASAGRSRATTTPRRVISTTFRSRSASRRISRHRALNSVAETVTSRIQIQGSLEALRQASQIRGRQSSNRLHKLRPVECRHLMAEGHTFGRQTANPCRKRYRCGTSRCLAKRCRHRDDDHRPPCWRSIESIVGDDDDRASPLLLGSRSWAQISPDDVSPPHRRDLPGVGFLRCVSVALSRSASRSAAVFACSLAYVSMSAASRLRRRSSSQWLIASRASVVAG